MSSLPKKLGGIIRLNVEKQLETFKQQQTELNNRINA